MTMKVEIQLDPGYVEPVVLLRTAEMTPELDDLVRRLSLPPKLLTGSRDGSMEILEPAEISRIYASGGKVLAVTDRGEYVLRQRLYELEERLDRGRFVRISNAEIINLKRAVRFDLRITGTVQIRLDDGTSAYVSRRYVGKIKQLLGV